MLYAEWFGKMVKVYQENKQILRQIRARRDVRCVQCSGEGNDGMIAITLDNGKTDLYRATGQIVRQG